MEKKKKEEKITEKTSEPTPESEGVHDTSSKEEQGNLKIEYEDDDLLDPSEENRGRILDTLSPQISYRDAKPEDIPRIQEIYYKNQYDRNAYKYIVGLSKEELYELYFSKEKSDKRTMLLDSLGKISGAGELLNISKDIWEGKVKNKKGGQKVMLVLNGEKIIGVNSYLIGPDAQETIDKQIERITFNQDVGVAWELRNRSVREDGKITYPNVVFVEDTFYDLDEQNWGLFDETYYEMSMREGLGEKDKIVFCINNTEIIYEEGTPEKDKIPLSEVTPKTSNFASIVASAKIGGQFLGKSTKDNKTAIPSFDKPGELILSENNKIIYVENNQKFIWIDPQTLINFIDESRERRAKKK